ncbi:unnamed protein product [Mucor hiemalis]
MSYSRFRANVPGNSGRQNESSSSSFGRYRIPISNATVAPPVTVTSISDVSPILISSSRESSVEAMSIFSQARSPTVSHGVGARSPSVVSLLSEDDEIVDSFLNDIRQDAPIRTRVLIPARISDPPNVAPYFSRAIIKRVPTYPELYGMFVDRDDITRYVVLCIIDGYTIFNKININSNMKHKCDVVSLCIMDQLLS